MNKIWFQLNLNLMSFEYSWWNIARIVTMIFMNLGSQLSEMSTISHKFTSHVISFSCLCHGLSICLWSLVRSCPFITLIKCLKGHKSVSESVSDKATNWAVHGKFEVLTTSPAQLQPKSTHFYIIVKKMHACWKGRGFLLQNEVLLETSLLVFGEQKLPNNI